MRGKCVFSFTTMLSSVMHKSVNICVRKMSNDRCKRIKMYFFLVICCSILLILIYYVFVKTFVENLRNSVPNEPKLVRSYIPIFGFSFAMSKNPVGLLQPLHRKHGPFFVIDLLYRRNIMLNDEKAFVNHIAKDHCFFLGFLNEIFTDFCGIRPECLTNEEMRLTTNKQLIDYLSGNELEMLNEKTFEHLIKRLNEDRSGDVLNLFDYFSEIMFDTTSTVLYGETFTQSQGKTFYSSCQNFDSAFGSLLIKIPFRAIFMSSAIRKRDEFVNRFRHLKINDDMSRLARARIEFFEDFNNGKEHFFTARDWAGQHAFLLWAAVINTIPVLCWTLVDILLHPEALEAVRKELRAFDKSKLYQKDILSNLIILESCIYETMRRTIVAKSVRQAECNTTVFCTNGLQFNVRENDMITYTACVKHLDPQV